MNSATSLDREVAPDIRGGPEAEFINAAAGGFEAIIGILRRHSDSYYMACMLSQSSKAALQAAGLKQSE